MTAKLYVLPMDPQSRAARDEKRLSDLIVQTLVSMYHGQPFDPNAGGLYYPPGDDQSQPYAGLKRLSGEIFDSQLYLALRDNHLSRGHGYHVFKFSPTLSWHYIDKVAPISYAFMSEARFEAGFETVADAPIRPAAKDRLRTIFMRGVRPNLDFFSLLPARRKLTLVEICTSEGLYAETPPSLRIVAKKDMAVLHHPQSFPEIITKDQAFLRLRWRDDNSPILALH